MTELEALIQKRYSERRYLPEAVSAEEILGIVETALHAPSPSGRKPFYFALVVDRQALSDLTSELAEGFNELRESSAGDESQLRIIDFYERYSLFIRDASALALCYTNGRETALSPWVKEAERETAAVISLGAVLQNIGLLCTQKGVGHCILSAAVELFPDVFSRRFPMPDHLKLRCLVSFGYPASAGRAEPAKIKSERYVKVFGR